MNEHDNATAAEQRAWEHYKKIEAENFELRKMNGKQVDEIKRLRRIIKNKKDYEKLNKRGWSHGKV